MKTLGNILTLTLLILIAFAYSNVDAKIRGIVLMAGLSFFCIVIVRNLRKVLFPKKSSEKLTRLKKETTRNE